MSTNGLRGDQDAAQLLATIVQSAEDSIIGKTLDGIVVSWNPAAERTFGYTAEEMLGQSISRLVPNDRLDELPESLERVRCGQRVDHRETVRVAKDGRRINVRVTVSPIRDPGGTIIGASTIARDVTERTHAEENFRGLLESAPDAMVIVGSDGRITLVNRQTEELFGYTREELLGAPVEMLVPAHFRDRHEDHRGGYFTAPRARPMGAELMLHGLRKDGSEFPVEISLSPLHTDRGVLASAAIRDVTGRRRIEAELARALQNEREASEQLRELDRMKDEFLSTVSHELRTPLTAIGAFAEVLISSAETTSETRPELFERISANASDMGAMIEQLLDYSRLEAGRVALEPGPLTLRTEALRCVEITREALGERRCAVDVPVDLEVVADQTGFERILINLLTNAAKYSPERSTIGVQARARSGEVIVTVRDEGIGIAPAEQERVFERFYQSSPVSGKRGTGIGLSIVRRYVELQGGRTWVESETGRGSTFFFTLPATTGSTR
jgi:PAS domain S-box-containing protein